MTPENLPAAIEIPPTTIETSRLTLRPYKPSDLPEYHALLSDEKNLYYLDDIIMPNIETSQASLDEAIAFFQSGQARRFAITITGDDQLIGSVGYDVTETTPLGRIGHMGWFLFPAHQSKGYMTEAANAILTYAFQSDNIIRITTGCHAENTPSRKVMEKLNFHQEATKIKAVYHDGKMKDRLEFAINKTDFVN